MLIFNESQLKQKIPQDIPLYLFPNIDSTNTYLIEQIPQKLPAFCLAESQSQGRGQHGRSWISPQGQNIYLSYLNYSPTPLHQLQDLSLQVGEALLKHLQTLKLPDLRLKWPNDILAEQQKLAGILVETKSHDSLSAYVIGIGLNVNMLNTKDPISQAWTSLTKLTGKTYDLNEIAAGLMKMLLNHFPPFTPTTGA